MAAFLQEPEEERDGPKGAFDRGITVAVFDQREAVLLKRLEFDVGKAPDLAGIGVKPEWDQWAYETFLRSGGSARNASTGPVNASTVQRPRLKQ